MEFKCIGNGLQTTGMDRSAPLSHGHRVPAMVLMTLTSGNIILYGITSLGTEISLFSKFGGYEANAEIISSFLLILWIL